MGGLIRFGSRAAIGASLRGTGRGAMTHPLRAHHTAPDSHWKGCARSCADFFIRANLPGATKARPSQRPDIPDPPPQQRGFQNRPHPAKPRVVGGVAERFNAPVLKTDVGESPPWVRIPPPPPPFHLV
jgi:hypothetical protein